MKMSVNIAYVNRKEGSNIPYKSMNT